MAAVNGVPVHFALKALRSYYAGRYALCGYERIGRGGLIKLRSAKPRGAAPSSFAALADSLAQDRATSHNGARYTTLPFQAQPRVASRPKSPARALATLFGLPATLRAGT